MPARTPRKLSDVRGTPRSAFLSLWRTHRPSPAPRNPADFLREHVWPWIVHYVSVLLRPKRAFRVYPQPLRERPGMVRIPNACKIAVAADWGTGTESAYKVARQMRSHQPDVTIHLGDVYYSGTAEEFRDFFLGKDDWPRGRLRTFALNANHEMYSGGEGYFDLALDALGQAASYFCLENDHFRIAAIDTGYFARSVPLLELLLPGLIRLHPENMRWLSSVVFADPADRRPVILLSHHQWFSAFDTEYKRLGTQLAPYLDRVVLWLWGHEHRFAAYGPYGFPGFPRTRSRCIGHGGMPIELGSKPRRDRNLIFLDQRVACELDGDRIGHCGFALMEVADASLRMAYIDDDGQELFKEEWTARSDGVTGRVLYASKALTLAPSKSLDALVSS